MAKRMELSAQERNNLQEELNFLHQKCNSLSMRGQYTECVRLIEQNLQDFYQNERWPERFYTILRLHQKCYPSLDDKRSHEEYATALLRKFDIPIAYVRFLYDPDTTVGWSSEHLRELSQQCQFKGDHEGAAAFCRLWLKTDPLSPNACVSLGRMLEQAGGGDEAVEMFQRALELNRTNHTALFCLAQHYKDSNCQKARDYLDQALELAPDTAEYYALKADLLAADGKWEEALAAYDRACAAEPYEAEYAYLKGELLMEMGKEATAVSQYNKAVQLNEQHVPSLRRLAGLGAESNPKQALSYIGIVTRQDPTDRNAMLLQARLQHKLDQTSAALRSYQKVLELDENCDEALGGMGKIFLSTSAQTALNYLERAVTTRPGVADYHMHKAIAHQKLEDDPAALKEYKTTVAIDHMNDFSWWEIGEITVKTKPEAAVEYYDKALEIKPEKPKYNTGKAELLRALPGRPLGEVVEAYQNACKYDPGNAELHLTLAQLLEQQGNEASAAEHYKTASSLDPENPLPHYRLARLLMDRNPAAALLRINAAIQLDAVNPEVYFVKAEILCRLVDAPQVLEQAIQTVEQSGKYEEAAHELHTLKDEGLHLVLLYHNRATERAPDNPVYLCERAHVLYRLGKKQEALDQYKRLLAINPKQHEALFGTARILAGQKDKKALEYFDRAIAEQPDNAPYHAEKAAFLAADPGNYAEALEEYATAIRLDNRAWQVVLEKARLLDQHGEPLAARAEYRRVLLIRQDNMEATLRMGELLADVSPRAALVYFDHAVELEGGTYALHAWRGRLLAQLGELERSAAEFQKAAALSGESGETYLQFAKITCQALPETALEHLKKAMELQPDQAEHYLLAGTAYLRLSRREEAVQSLTRALELDSGCHEAREMLAALWLEELDERCREQIEAGLEQRPDCARCHHLMARLLWKLDQKPVEAADMAARAVKLAPSEPAYRQLLVELLKQNRSYLRLMVEKRNLAKLSRRLQELEVIPDPPEFGTSK